MLEVLSDLPDSRFKTYVVTGGGQEFVRVYSQPVYGVPPEQVIGSSIETKFEDNGGQPVLMRLPKVFFIDDHAGKAVGINLFIGKRPFAAFGNSAGHREMLEWTGAGDGVRLTMLVYRDDTEREYAYGPAGSLAATKVGAFPDSLMSEAKQKGWVVISMKADWRRAFIFESSWIRAGRPRARRPADRTGCYGPVSVSTQAGPCGAGRARRLASARLTSAGRHG